MAGFCSACGAQVIEGGAFCPKCGKATNAQPLTSGTAASPAPAPKTPPAKVSSATTGLEENLAGLLAYFFLPAIVFLFLEPYNRSRFVRFHSFQAIALGVIAILMHAVLAISLIGVILLIPFDLLWVMVSVVCMIKAYQSQVFRLPVIGEFAEKKAGE